MGHSHPKDANGAEITFEQVELLYQFLQGNQVGTIHCESMPHLSEDEAFSVIYYLQEGLEVLPDRIEQCLSCKTLIDDYCEGYYKEDVGHYCDNCAPEAGSLEPEETAAL